MICSLCPRKCNAKRTDEEGFVGFCNAPESPKIARYGLHMWEEPPISGKNSSGTVFFSGCSLSCVYCQNFEVSRSVKGEAVTPKRLAEIFYELEENGAHNINLVTADHYVLAVKKALSIYKPKIPIVLNSSGYITKNQLDILGDDIDIFLVDFKYISYDRAKKYSGAEDYPDIARNAIRYMLEKQPECVFDKSGIMQKGVIIRHLLMPLGTNEAIKVFDTVLSDFKGAYFSLMAQYIPMGDLEKFPEINRKITKREYEKVVSHIVESGFENCFVQDLSSADKKYIPDFR
ncbi:MAG: radical SAM protein [Clostridia bacterium]|nr:radical SAM protein [Clostridia bacterium]